MSSQAEKDLEDFKAKWIGRKVQIVGVNHPHFGETGLVESVGYTAIGYGMRLSLEDSPDGCYVFKGSDIKVLYERPGLDMCHSRSL